MHCTSCGTAIPDGARFCPGCGTGSGIRTNRAGPAGAAPKDKSTAKIGGCGFVLLVIAVLWGAAELAGGGKDAAKPLASAAEIQAADKTAVARAKACDDGLADLEKAGVLKARPASNRIEVEEALWAQLPAQEKRLFAAAVRCSARGGREPADGGIDLNDYGEVDGYRSGKELAMATSAGVTLN